MVDVAEEGSELPFTFTGQQRAELPDHAPADLSGTRRRAEADDAGEQQDDHRPSGSGMMPSTQPPVRVPPGA